MNGIGKMLNPYTGIHKFAPPLSFAEERDALSPHPRPSPANAREGRFVAQAGGHLLAQRSMDICICADISKSI